MNVAAAQFGDGARMPLDPPVQDRLVAVSCAMKKNAIVITTNVCRLTRSAMSPSGTESAAATPPASGSSAKTGSPFSCHALAAMPTV